jgi:hypothetical protein
MVSCTKVEEGEDAINMRKYSVLFKDAENDSNHDDDSEVEVEEEKYKKSKETNGQIGRERRHINRLIQRKNGAK